MIRPGNWQAFLPACTLFAIGYIPLLALDLWARLVGPSDQIVGAGLAWGSVVTTPATVCGGLAILGGLVWFFVVPKDNSK
jgi:hypothetical protein